MKLIREPDCRALTGIPRSTRYALMAKGQFPRPIKIGQKAVAWVESDVLDWIHNRIEQSKGRKAHDGMHP